MYFFEHEKYVVYKKNFFSNLPEQPHLICNAQGAYKVEHSPTPKEDKPPNKGQAESTLVYTLYRKSPLKEDNLSTKDKTTGPVQILFGKLLYLSIRGGSRARKRGVLLCAVKPIFS